MPGKTMTWELQIWSGPLETTQPLRGVPGASLSMLKPHLFCALKPEAALLHKEKITQAT
jgi:hypothetical protein